jgi:hypothetical protein
MSVISLFLYLDVNLLSDLFKNQIIKVIITINFDNNLKHYPTMRYISNHIFTVFQKLTDLIFLESSHQTIVELPFIYPPINFCSSTLLVLNVKIMSFDTCLCFVDGRFNQLHTLIVESACIYRSKNLANQVSFY